MVGASGIEARGWGRGGRRGEGGWRYNFFRMVSVCERGGGRRGEGGAEIGGEVVGGRALLRGGDRGGRDRKMGGWMTRMTSRTSRRCFQIPVLLFERREKQISHTSLFI